MIQVDHSEYPKTLKSKSIAQLYFIIRDCQQAIQANPDNPKNGYYQDEISYCGMEIRNRQNS